MTDVDPSRDPGQENPADGAIARPSSEHQDGIMTSTKLLIAASVTILVMLAAIVMLAGWVLKGSRSFEVVALPPVDQGAYHKAVADRVVQLKAMVVSPPASRFSYEWDFGDDSDPITGSVKDHYDVGARHVFEDAESGDKFIATLTVTNRETGKQQVAQYPIQFVRAAPPDHEDIAVEDGLWALHATASRAVSAADGRTIQWDETDAAWRGTLAICVHAFQMLGHDSHEDAFSDPYAEDVQRGLNKLLQHLEFQDVESVGKRDPDSNGNKKGLCVAASRRPVIETAFTLLAIASSNAPAQRALAGWQDPDDDDELTLNGMTYREIASELVDYLAFAQNDTDDSRGGWEGTPNGTASEMVTTGWVVLSLHAAECGMGLKAPDWLREELLEFLKQVQGEDGGFGYQAPSENVAATAAGILCLTYCGVLAEDERIKDAIEVIAENWDEQNIGDYQTMFCVSQAAQVASTPIYRFGEHDWRSEYKAFLIQSQEDDGCWLQEVRRVHNEPLTTAWALMVLKEKAMVSRNTSISPVVVVVAAILAVVIVGVLLRRRRSTD